MVKNLPELPVCDGYTSCQLATVPFVCRNFPALPNCAGSTEEKAVAATNAVVAILVLESPVVGVGAVGVPVNAGESMLAFELTAACMLTNSTRIGEDRPLDPAKG